MTSAENLENLPESVRDSKLDARFWSNEQESYVSHPFRGSFRSGRPEEKWLHVKNLGIGGGGTVDLQKRDSAVPGKPCYRAVKCIRVPEERPTHKSDKYARELEALVKFSHAKYSDLFVASLGWFTSRNHIHIAMEYCELGDLQRYLKKCSRGFIPEPQAREVALQLLDALLMMHREGFAHRDLKPANILITSCPPNSWHVKLSDFGISKRSADSGESTTLRGTPGFMPPEILGFIEKEDINYYAVDMWCFGETLFRMLAGRPTFSYHAHLSDYARGNIGLPKDVLQNLGVSEQAIDLFVSLLAIHPAKRITTLGVSKHAWLVADIVQPCGSQIHHLHTTENPELSEVLKTETVSEVGEASVCWSSLPPTKSVSQDKVPKEDEALTKLPSNCVLQTIEGNKRKIDHSLEKGDGNRKKLRLSCEGDQGVNVGAKESHCLPNNRTSQAHEQVTQVIEKRGVDPLLTNNRNQGIGSVKSVGSSHANGNADDVLVDAPSFRPSLKTRAAVSMPSFELDAHVRTPYLRLLKTLECGDFRDTQHQFATMYGLKVHLRHLQHLLPEREGRDDLKRMYYKAIDMRQRKFGRGDRMAIEMMDLLSQFLIERREYECAEVMAKQTLACRKELSQQPSQDGDDEAEIWTLSLLANALQLQGKRLELIPLSKDLVSRSREKWGSKDLRTLTNMRRHAILLRRLKKYPGAEQLFRETAQIMQDVLGTHSADTLTCKVDLAVVLAKQNRMQEAKTVTSGLLRAYRAPGSESFIAGLQVLSSAFREQSDKEMASLIDYDIHRLKGGCAECGRQASSKGPMKPAVVKSVDLKSMR